MSDGISDGFPFDSQQSYKLTEQEQHELIVKLVKAQLAKDAKIRNMRALLEEIRDWYVVKDTGLHDRINEVLK